MELSPQMNYTGAKNHVPVIFAAHKRKLVDRRSSSVQGHLIFLSLGFPLQGSFLLINNEKEGALPESLTPSRLFTRITAWRQKKMVIYNSTPTSHPFPHPYVSFSHPFSPSLLLCFFLSLFPSFWRLDNLCIREPKLKSWGQKPRTRSGALPKAFVGSPEMKARAGRLVSPGSCDAAEEGRSHEKAQKKHTVGWNERWPEKLTDVEEKRVTKQPKNHVLKSFECNTLLLFWIFIFLMPKTALVSCTWFV